MGRRGGYQFSRALKFTSRKADNYSRMIIRHCLSMLVVCVCIGAAAAHGRGYLSTTGPSPLRFLPQVAAGGKSPLPPLPLPKEEANVHLLATANSKVVETVSAMPAPVSASTVATNEFELTPQMLIDVLRSRAKSGNLHDAHVLVPFGFVPPAGQTPPSGLVPSPSSTATYRVE